MHRRWRGARTALPSRRWDPPWPFVEPPPPELPARWRAQAGRPWPFPALRRGQSWPPPWPHPSPRNRFEGTNGVDVTVGNSSGPGSDAWDSVSATAPVYDTSTFVTGSSSAHVSLAAQSTARVRWSTLFGSRALHFGRVYVRVPSAPPQIARVFQQDSQAGASQWGVGFDTAGKLIVRDLAAGVTVFTSTATPATGVWHRVEWQAVWDGVNTVVTVRLYLAGNLHGLTPDEEGASSSFAQAAPAGSYDFGLRTTTAATWDIHLDDAGLDATIWIGPSGTPFPPVGQMGRSRVLRGQPAAASWVAHGRRWDAPVPPAAAPETPWTVTRVGSRARWAVRPRRGRRWDAPPVEAPPAPTPWTVTGVGTRSSWTAPKPRGTRWDPPWPSAVPPPPELPATFRRGRAVAPLPHRRGRQWSPPPAVPWVPPSRRSRPPRSWPLLARGHRWSPPWLDGAVNPGVWQPGFRRQQVALPRFAHRLRRGRQFCPPWPQIIPPEIVKGKGTTRVDASSAGGTRADRESTGGAQVTKAASGTVEVD